MNPIHSRSPPHGALPHSTTHSMHAHSLTSPPPPPNASPYSTTHSPRLTTTTALPALLIHTEWHLGFARPVDLPEERGFDAYLGYLTGGEDYYTHAASGGPGCKKATDLWFGTPGKGRNPSAKTGFYNGTYSTELYASFLTKRIAAHDPTKPLFMYAAFQGVHYPLQVPRRFFDRYAAQGAGTTCVWERQRNTTEGYANGFTCDHNDVFPAGQGPVGLDCECNRLLVKAQVSSLSEAVGNITAALKANGDMWANR